MVEVGSIGNSCKENRIKNRATLIDGDDIPSAPAKSTYFALHLWHDLQDDVKAPPSINLEAQTDGLGQ